MDLVLIIHKVWRLPNRIKIEAAQDITAPHDFLSLVCV